MSQPGKKGSKLGHQVPAAEFVLETFGNSRTLFNPNASHFGKYTELQFTERGRICGVKTLDYYLERSRVSGAPSGERNFHIFYYLVAGAAPTPMEPSFQQRRRRAAKLTNFFGVNYRDLMSEILESIEKGLEEERGKGTLKPDEVKVRVLI